jgi:glucosamine-6-phosphate deaminase
MQVIATSDLKELGKRAAGAASEGIRNAIVQKGKATIILATGTSQFETLNHLVHDPLIDWSKVVMFHLDEYIGLPETSPASFRRYLKERFIEKVPSLQAYYLIDGEADPVKECKRIGDIILQSPVDVALVGVGENGHLAFNDPPADFDTEDPYIIVSLDEQCRQQQYAEGWFTSASDVPQKAISMSIRQICKSKQIICSVPDSRKAKAVRDCLEQNVSNLYPASILQVHPDCTYYLDKHSSALLSTGLVH